MRTEHWNHCSIHYYNSEVYFTSVEPVKSDLFWVIKIRMRWRLIWLNSDWLFNLFTRNIKKIFLYSWMCGSSSLINVALHRMKDDSSQCHPVRVHWQLLVYRSCLCVLLWLSLFSGILCIATVVGVPPGTIPIHLGVMEKAPWGIVEIRCLPGLGLTGRHGSSPLSPGYLHSTWLAHRWLICR